MPQNIILPSTMSGIVRSVIVDDSNKMSDSTMMHDLRHVLRDAFTVVDPGIYSATQGPSGPVIDWSGTYFCDRFRLMLACSVLTYGPKYRFKYPCKNPDSPCRHKGGGDRPHPIPWALDLTQLTVKSLPEATLEQLKAGVNRFETSVPVGQSWDDKPSKVAFQLLTEKVEVDTANRLEAGWGRKKRARIQARAQILEIDGRTDSSYLDNVIDKMNRGLLDNLRSKMEEVDGGVQTAIIIFCDRCGWEHALELPLDGLFRMRLRPFDHELAEALPSDSAAPNSSALSTSEPSERSAGSSAA